MKHSGPDRRAVDRVVEWLGRRPLSPLQGEQLECYGNWLRDEAIAAGGIGPREADRIWSRHLADSLTFAIGWAERTPPPRILDVGAGVGLPGIPLAILCPEIAVTLLDRAGRRVDLAGRAVRVVGVRNVEVRQGDARQEPPQWEAAVFRAVFRPAEACEVATTVLSDAGTAVIGLRGRDQARAHTAPSGSNRTLGLREVPAKVLDGGASLLIMGPCED